MRLGARRTIAILAVAAAALASASPASAEGGAIILNPDNCVLGPTLGPAVGLPELTPLECQFVITPSGRFNSSFHGQVPAGTEVPETISKTVTTSGPQGPTTCHITVTKSGKINGSCHR